MRIPEYVAAIIRQVFVRFPYGEDSESKRQFMRRVAEQLAYSVGAAWGYYKTEGSGPPSKDCLVYRDGDDWRGWDIITGSGALVLTGDEVTFASPQFHGVLAVNHLESVPSEPPPQDPYPGDLSMRVAALEATVNHIVSYLRGV